MTASVVLAVFASEIWSQLQLAIPPNSPDICRSN
jgi:hypothetical protein